MGISFHRKIKKKVPEYSLNSFNGNNSITTSHPSPVGNGRS